ncbi:type II toxin-antitoxin system MqsR family toxin [Candidatus Marithrix sp. Canyon 246]|uniref:type II toxin-antitoxin system MqsR family toxin n=1 Tax=Candidatus Marithrix sp. Canyon 246 TaxID=1827136 RepID=UPI0009F651BC|nr:type II toxin-antitoxin system MqsR family toxin [Candidatus Marithrix sp. Canyon 246]
MAEYKLKDVKAAAQQLNIEYRGRKVFRDIANLGYELKDIADCLSKLTPNEYRKTHHYDKCPPDDEYICSYIKADDDKVDELYVKFCLIDDCLVIDLASFHLPQF